MSSLPSAVAAVPRCAARCRPVTARSFAGRWQPAAKLRNTMRAASFLLVRWNPRLPEHRIPRWRWRASRHEDSFPTAAAYELVPPRDGMLGFVGYLVYSTSHLHRGGLEFGSEHGEERGQMDLVGRMWPIDSGVRLLYLTGTDHFSKIK